MTATLARSIVIAAALLSGCASTSDVQTTVDPDANLSGFRTFVFLESAPKAPGEIADKQVRERLRRMIAERIASRGYTQVLPGQPADLGVLASGQVAAKQSALMVGRPGPYDYNWGGRTELGGYDTVDYRQGTLFVDIVEVGKNRLLWRTRISEALTPQPSEENWKKVDRSMDEAFKTLPSRQ